MTPGAAGPRSSSQTVRGFSPHSGAQTWCSAGMSARRLTRRSLLAGGAGVIAAGMLHPAGVLAALARPPRPTLDTCSLGRLLPGRTRTLELGRVADLVGLSWADAPAHAGLELRYRTARGGWSRWVAAGGRGHGPDVP